MKPMDKLFTDIAREHLFIETLETRKSDRLDFHDVSVSGVRDALSAAYQAGQREGTTLSARAATSLPIVVVTVRGGCVANVEATIPLRAVLEDWDCQDRVSAKKPYRAELPYTGKLSAKRAHQYRRGL
jgi:hypothetical protein